MEKEKSVSLEEEQNEDESRQYSKMPEAVLMNLKKTMNRIDSMNEKELISKLKCFHLDTVGNDNTLRLRLKDSYRKIILTCKDISVSPELLPYYVIIDFEATCEEVNPPDYRHEIIEFPAVIVDSKKQEIIDTFQMYCKPKINPKISKFCMELTGITQEQVDSAESFEKVLEHFQIWLAKHNLGKKYAIVTDGPWDMTRFLYSQCYHSGVNYPKWGTKWVNLKKAFSRFYQCDRFCLRNMLEFLELEFIGRPHCGLDDAKNIARILLKMIYDGANIQVNEKMKVSSKKKEIMKLEKNTKVTRNDEECDNIKMKKMRMQAYFIPVTYIEKLPVYKYTKRDRLISEVQIAKKIFKNSNTSGKLSCQSKLPITKV